MAMEIRTWTALELGRKIKEREITVKEAVEASFARIREVEDQVHAFVTLVDQEYLLEQAREVQSRIDRGELTGPLAGVPVAVKDNLCTKGILTTCGSNMLRDFKPPYSAEAVQKLEQAGAIIIGKTNMDEFSMGSTTETSAYGITRNPWNLNHVPGGSSGGTCAAVAAEECFCGLGSDTGGSIRQPSSYCGVTGLKPTYGTVSRNGLVAYASSLEQIGPVGRDVADCAALLQTIAGHDPQDSTSVQGREYDFLSALKEDVKGMKVGIPVEYLENGMDDDVKNGIWTAAKALEERGAVVEEIHLELSSYAVPAYYVIASAEASSNLARFDGVKYGHRTQNKENGLHGMYKQTRSEGFGTEVKRRIMLGSYVLSSGYYDAYYLKALRTKTLIKEEFNRTFSKYDLILGPVAPTVAPKIGSSLEDPVKMYLGDVYTVSANLAGLPAISVQWGLDRNGMPIGVQLMADCFQEKKIICGARALEKSRKYQRPVMNVQ